MIKRSIKYSLLLTVLLANASIQASRISFNTQDDNPQQGDIQLQRVTITGQIQIKAVIVNGVSDSGDAYFVDNDGLMLKYGNGGPRVNFSVPDAVIGYIIGAGDNVNDLGILPFNNSKPLLVYGQNVTIAGKIGQIDYLDLNAKRPVLDASNNFTFVSDTQLQVTALDTNNHSTTTIKPSTTTNPDGTLNKISGLMMKANNISLSLQNNIAFDASGIDNDVGLGSSLSMEMQLAGGIYSTAANQGSVSFNTIANKNIVLYGGIIGGYNGHTQAVSSAATLSTIGTGTVTLYNGIDTAGTSGSINAVRATNISVTDANFGAAATTINNDNFAVTGNLNVNSGATLNLKAPTTSGIGQLIIADTGVFNLQADTGKTAVATINGLDMTGSARISAGAGATLNVKVDNPIIRGLSIAGGTINLTGATDTVAIDALTLTNSGLDLKNANTSFGAVIINAETVTVGGVPIRNTTPSYLSSTKPTSAASYTAISIPSLTINAANFNLPKDNTPAIGTLEVNGPGASNINEAHAIGSISLNGATLSIGGTASTLIGAATVSGTSSMNGSALASIPTLSLTNGAALTLQAGSNTPITSLQLAQSGSATLNNAGTITGVTLDGATLNLGSSTLITNLIVNGSSGSASTVSGAGNVANITLNGAALTLQNPGTATFAGATLNLGTHDITATNDIQFSGINTINTTVVVDGSGHVTANGKIIATGAINAADGNTKINVVITAATSDGLVHIPAGTIVEVLSGTINATISSASAAPRTLAVSSERGKVEFVAATVPPVTVPPSNPSNPGGPGDPSNPPGGGDDDNPPEPQKDFTDPQDVTLDKRSLDDDMRLKAEAIPATLISEQRGAVDDYPRTQVWTNFFNGEASRRGSSALPGYASELTGGLVGIMTIFPSNLSLGITMGEARADYAYTGNKTGDKLSIGSKMLYVHGDYRWHDSGVFLGAVVNYIYSDINSRHARKVAKAEYLDAIGNWQAQTFGGTAKIGYVSDVFKTLRIATPLELKFISTIGVTSHCTAEQNYAEQGAKEWNFAIGEGIHSSSTFNYGAKLALKHKSHSPELEIHLNVYEPFQKTKETLNYRFAGLPRKQLTATRVAPASRSNFGGSLNFNIERVNIRLGVDTHLEDRLLTSHGYISAEITF